MESAIAELRGQLLGVPSVTLGESPVTFQRRGSLALLTYLAVSRTAHSRDSLATLLGGDVADDQARKLLSNVLTDLRHSLADYLLITPRTVAFRHDQPHWLDVVEFSAHLASGLAAADSGPLQAAVALYRGEFLEGLSIKGAPDFDAWLVARREAYHRQLVQALRALIDRAVHDRAPEEGITAARRLLGLEPWLEVVHRQLMMLLAWGGQREEALAQYDICCQVLRDELDAEPAAETTALYTRLRGAGQTPLHNLKASPTATVGREAQVALLVERLADPAYRLVSLVGLGGSGKSRLAREVARHFISPSAPLVEQPFADGVFLVRLEDEKLHGQTANEVALQRRLATALARTLRVPLVERADPARQVYAHVRAKALLLVLDGFEDWLAALPVLTGLLATAPQVKLLVTSRRHLHLPQEHVLEVGGLALPATPADLERAGASVLLLQAARRVQLDYQWPEEERARVVRLCDLLGGVPLALVLVAPWLRLLGPGQIQEELERGLDLLRTTDPTVPLRHRDLRMVLRQSWDRLTLAEQQVMRQLSVFTGGFDARAGEAVAGVTLPLLRSLSEAGMLMREVDGRYRAHALVLQCAAEEARQHPAELASARARHARYYADLLSRLTPGLRHGDQAREQVRAEASNLRAAWHWAVMQGAFDLPVQMSVGLNLYWEVDGLFDEAAAMFGEAVRDGATRADAPAPHTVQEQLARLRIGESLWLVQCGRYPEAERVAQEVSATALASTSPALLAELAHCQGELAAHQLRWTEARPRLEQAVRLARTAGRWDLEARSLDRLAQAVTLLGEPETAMVMLERALSVRREQNDRVGLGQSLTCLCFVQSLLGNYQSAIDAGEQAVHAYRLVGARAGEAVALAFLGEALSLVGRLGEAERCQLDAVRITDETSWRLYYPRCLIDLGRIERLQGDFASARAHLAEALMLCREVGRGSFAARARVELSRVDHAQGHHHEALQHQEEALAVFASTGEERERQKGLMALGNTRLSLGNLAAAGEAYQEAISVASTWRARGLVIEAAAGLAEVALLSGDLAEAQAHVAGFVDDLLTRPLAHADDPARVYLTTYETLQRLADPRSERLLAAGYQLLERRAASITNDVRRGCFLDAIQSNRLLVQAWQERRVARGTI